MNNSAWNRYVERGIYIDNLMQNLTKEDIDALENGCGSKEIGHKLSAIGLGLLTRIGLHTINLPEDLRKRLAPACRRHDVAYIAGEVRDYGELSRLCDDLRFLADSLFLSGWSIRCHIWSILAYRAVRRVGFLAYEYRDERLGIVGMRSLAARLTRDRQ